MDERRMPVITVFVSPPHLLFSIPLEGSVVSLNSNDLDVKVLRTGQRLDAKRASALAWDISGFTPSLSQTVEYHFLQR